MKTSHCGIALALASALAFSSLAQADTLPTGAQRFSLYTLNDALNPIDIPMGRTLVITDLAFFGGGLCTFLGGSEPEATIVSQTPTHLQTGIEFNTQLTTYFQPCFSVFLSGYWLDATANR